MNNINRMIDHTNLKPTASAADIEKLCAEAREYHFASVCIHPCFCALAKKLLAGSDVKVCTVIGFPLGQNKTSLKVAEAKEALADGCDEFDMVINVGALKEGKADDVRKEIAAIVKAVAGHTVKVIIETCLLTDEEKILAVRLSCEAGASFVKTSTGFSTGGATAEDVRLMKANVTPGVLVKAAGGIRSGEAARAMVEAGADRIGTSSGITIVRELSGN